MSPGIEVILADLDEPVHADAIVRIIDAYAREAGGQGKPLSESANERMIAGLKDQANAFVLLATRTENRPESRSVSGAFPPSPADPG